MPDTLIVFAFILSLLSSFVVLYLYRELSLIKKAAGSALAKLVRSDE